MQKEGGGGKNIPSDGTEEEQQLGGAVLSKSDRPTD